MGLGLRQILDQGVPHIYMLVQRIHLKIFGIPARCVLIVVLDNLQRGLHLGDPAKSLTTGSNFRVGSRFGGTLKTGNVRYAH